MEKFKLEDFTKGWFVGNFDPSLIKTGDFEVGAKTYRKGDKEEAHYHKIADEITVVVKGVCKINGHVLHESDIIWIKPGEIAKFEALEDCTTTVVKVPSLVGDKYKVG